MKDYLLYIIIKLEKYTTIFFYGFSIFVLCLIILAFILTLANIFFYPLILISTLISLIVTLLVLRKTQKDLYDLPSISIPMIIIIFIVSSIIIFFPHDSFEGPDNSFYTNMAVHLAKDGTLNLPKYLNNLPNQPAEEGRSRMPAYTVWLAIQQIFFGEEWLLRSNVLIISLGLFALFITSTLIAGKKNSLLALILFSTCMPFIWFSREALTEDMSFFLLWILILFFIIFIKTRRYLFLMISLITVWLFAFCRVEGFFMQFSLMLAHLFILFTWKTRKIKKYIITITIYIIIIVSCILTFRFFSFSSYIETIVGGASVGINRGVSSLTTKITHGTINTIVKEPKLSEKIPFFIYNMLAKYNYILVFASVLFLCCLIYRPKSKYSNLTKIYFSAILLILIPEFYKFIDPGVSLSQPWLYRRYMYALLPFGYICLVLFIRHASYKNKYISIFIINLLLFINLLLSYNIIILKNNWLLIDKIYELTKDISSNDVIIDDHPFGNYGINSVLTLNKKIRCIASSIFILQKFLPENKILNNRSYNKIYMISAENKEKFESLQLKKKSTVNIEYSQLEPSCAINLLGEELQLSDPNNWSGIPYKDAINYCKHIDYKIEKHKGQLYLYELL